MMPENVISARCRACVPPGSGEAWVRQSGKPSIPVDTVRRRTTWMPDIPRRTRRSAPATRWASAPPPAKRRVRRMHSGMTTGQLPITHDSSRNTQHVSQGATLTSAIYPASFDPIHYGHIDIAKRAASIFDRVIVAVYDRPMKNLLFNIDERLHLVEQALHAVPNVEIARYSGLTVEYARQVGAQVIVRGLRVVSDFELEWHMALTNKQLAPDIEVVCLMTSQAYAFLSSSTLREVGLLGGDVSSMAPSFVVEALQRKAVEHALDPINQPVPITSLRD